MSPSSFAWVDFAEGDRRRMAEVVRLFNEPDARDELGIGVIRDALSEALFPGTSTIQTRARYFLFVPWLYRRLEEKGVASTDILKRIQSDETRLIAALKAGGEETGVIGVQAGGNLDRFPSEVYWSGLLTLGIRTYPGSIDSYHRNFELICRQRESMDEGSDGSVGQMATGAWDVRLPEEPEGLLQATSFALTADEALYLKERISSSRDGKGSVLGDLVSRGRTPVESRFVWELEVLGRVRERFHPLVEHARVFALLMHGASLLYNEMICSEAPVKEDRREVYRGELLAWAEEVTSDETVKQWSREDFWSVVAGAGAIVGLATRRFVDAWLDIALSPRTEALADDKAARDLIFRRETQLKRGVRSRLNPKNLRTRERWNGASGTNRLDYRWSRVRAISNDIVTALDS